MGGILGRAGRWLAASRYLRERAFYDVVPDILLPRRPGELRALEIGCGGGKLLLDLSRAGWCSEGFEVDPIAAQIARDRSGRPVRVGDFRKEEIPSGSYDLVVLNHVLEHLENPIAALQRVRELLAPGGRVVIFYPNPEGLGARVYDIHWLAWDVPRHLVLPPGRELAKHVRRVGLVPTQVRSTARGAEGVFALSRAQKQGESVVVGEYQLRAIDRILTAAEGLLVRLGFFAGEEVIMAFTSVEDGKRVESIS
jgi:SAM-dependent methyltransferase